ncbi:hypothetical protein QJS83_03765 [Bdellovibrio sp. 22V]|uniref:hypothetical protein n=1 Tax=Bdellovibrio TaxID=958 RepID=UPI002542EC60|nr:hypothetical protein [Bdellovibrio sp. 22V]WII72987.1 hypothetical protein QJS83_03765 [Bdellovibrio sp. 22V]
MGETLTKTVIAATGLPQDPVEREFNTLLAKHGKSPETLTLEELREVMADYLQTVFLEMQNEQSA